MVLSQETPVSEGVGGPFGGSLQSEQCRGGLLVARAACSLHSGGGGDSAEGKGYGPRDPSTFSEGD